MHPQAYSINCFVGNKQIRSRISWLYFIISWVNNKVILYPKIQRKYLTFMSDAIPLTKGDGAQTLFPNVIFYIAEDQTNLFWEHSTEALSVITNILTPHSWITNVWIEIRYHLSVLLLIVLLSLHLFYYFVSFYIIFIYKF